MAIRLEDLADHSSIHPTHTAAFGRTAGPTAFSPLVPIDAPDVKACAPAPLAGGPAYRRQGIGWATARKGLQRLRQGDLDLALVLGEAGSYGRLGFSAELAERLKTPYDGSYPQALALSRKGLEAHGPAAYAPAFAELT